MTFRVYFKHMPSSMATYAYAEKKLGSVLEKYALRVVEAHLTFLVENDTFKVSCHVVADGGINIALEAEDTVSMAAAIDRLEDKVDARLLKERGKLRSHRGVPLKIAVAEARQADTAAATPDGIDASEILEMERARNLDNSRRTAAEL